ncbi:MAG: polyprenyl synthetase family protein [Myxococcota bacterium]
MSLIEAVRHGGSDVLSSLRNVCDDRGLDALSRRLAELGELLQADMRAVADGMKTVPRGDARVQKAAHHLLDRGGKRLRPMCVALASRVGSGFDDATQELAVSVELVHAATLLHDDVVDVGDTRRGAAAARMVYGNAASIFAGDWLLVEALRRVRRVRVADTLDRLLDVIDEMIFAESLQLENRGRADTSIEDYFRVIDGKTAALFRWACFAGGRGGGLDDDACRRLEAYGGHLGVAFQLVDDLLDYTGTQTGKDLFTDLREGKLTHPLLLARDRNPQVRAMLEELAASTAPSPTLHRRLVEAVQPVLKETRDLAIREAATALAEIEELPAGKGRDGLRTVALATVERER